MSGSDSFPGLYARTQGFTAGVPRGFSISPDGSRIAFLRSADGFDAVMSLWVLEVDTGTERRVADPRVLDPSSGPTPRAEVMRRDLAHEPGSGIVAFAADHDLRTALFALSGRLFAADLQSGGVRELPAANPAYDPRPDPTGRLGCYVGNGALRIVGLADGDDRALLEPEESSVSYGMAEVAAPTGRLRGFWWAPDGSALLVARVRRRSLLATRRQHVQARDGKVAYTAAWVLPSAKEAPQRDAAVLVDAGTIVAISGRDAIPAEYRRVELGDQWLLPGLIDAHVHLVWDGGTSPDEALRAQTRELSTLLSASRARDHVMDGVTTVRDLGAPQATILAVRDAIREGAVVGARVVAAGNLVGRVGKDDPMIVVAADADEARQAVQDQLDAGVDVVKLIATGGVFTVARNLDETDLGPVELAAAVATAHDAGRVVAVHAYTPAGIRNAVDAGADTIEHGSFLDEPTAKAAAAGGVILVPTLLAYRRYVQVGVAGGLPERSVEKATRAVDAGRLAVGYALEHGVAIAAGTDGGGRSKRHGMLAQELGCLVECGLSAADALEAGTTISARACGRTDIGAIRAGYRADLIGVTGDPTADIAALADVRTAVADGRLVKLGGQPVAH